MKKVIILLFIVIFVVSLGGCKSKDEKYSELFSLAQEYLTENDFESSAKYFNKAKKYSNNDFSEGVKDLLKNYWVDYISGDSFEKNVLSGKAEKVVAEMKMCYYDFISESDAMYEVFLSNIHYFKAMALIKIDREENITTAIKELSLVSENDVEYYDLAQQELMYLEEDKNRLYVKYLMDVETDIKNNNVTHAKENFNKLKNVTDDDYEEQTNQISKKIQELENQERLKKEKSEKKKKNMHLAEQGAMKVDNLVAGTFLADNFQEIISASCIGYLLNEDIYFIYIRHISSSFASIHGTRAENSIIAIMLDEIDNKIYYELCGWESQAYDRTTKELFIQLPSIIDAMSKDGGWIFDTTVFPDDLSFDYTEYANKYME